MVPPVCRRGYAERGRVQAESGRTRPTWGTVDAMNQTATPA